MSNPERKNKKKKIKKVEKKKWLRWDSNPRTRRTRRLSRIITAKILPLESGAFDRFATQPFLEKLAQTKLVLEIFFHFLQFFEQKTQILRVKNECGINTYFRKRDKNNRQIKSHLIEFEWLVDMAMNKFQKLSFCFIPHSFFPFFPFLFFLFQKSFQTLGEEKKKKRKRKRIQRMREENEEKKRSIKIKEKSNSFFIFKIRCAKNISRKNNLLSSPPSLSSLFSLLSLSLYSQRTHSKGVSKLVESYISNGTGL